MEKPNREHAVRMVIPSPQHPVVRVSRAVARLRIAVESLVEQRWSGAARSRAKLSAEVAVKTCSEAGNYRAAKVARAILALSQLSLADVLPIRETLGEKIFELLGILGELTGSDVA
jgi:hypothetical protein